MMTDFRFQPLIFSINIKRQQLEITLFFGVRNDTGSRRARRDLYIPLSDDTNYDTFNIIEFLQQDYEDLFEINAADEVRPKIRGYTLDRIDQDSVIKHEIRLIGVNEEDISSIDRAMIIAFMDSEYWEATITERSIGH